MISYDLLLLLRYVTEDSRKMEAVLLEALLMLDCFVLWFRSGCVQCLSRPCFILAVDRIHYR